MAPFARPSSSPQPRCDPVSSGSVSRQPDPPEPAPTERFHDRADDYARSRPSYPEAAVAAILHGITADPPHVADLGAGTGILSRLLADRGAVVTALEPNASMRDAAAPHPRVRWAAGTAEATGLPAGAFDAVTVAQAWHWFDHERHHIP